MRLLTDMRKGKERAEQMEFLNDYGRLCGSYPLTFSILRVCQMQNISSIQFVAMNSSL